MYVIWKGWYGVLYFFFIFVYVCERTYYTHICTVHSFITVISQYQLFSVLNIRFGLWNQYYNMFLCLSKLVTNILWSAILIRFSFSFYWFIHTRRIEYSQMFLYEWEYNVYNTRMTKSKNFCARMPISCKWSGSGTWNMLVSFATMYGICWFVIR